MSSATSFFIRPFSEFTEGAVNIVRGSPTDIHTENGMTPDGKTIYTYANLQIKEVLKGDISGSQIQIRRLGGSKDGITLEIPSSVNFVENEDSVFFLGERKEDHSYEVRGMELGKFKVENKQGVEILTGGLFAYSKEGHHDSNTHEGNLDENKKDWSIHELRELIQKQGSAPQLKETLNISPSATNTPVVDQNAPNSEQTPVLITNNIPQEKTNSGLYFGQWVWYAMATLILTMCVFFYLRRGK